MDNKKIDEQAVQILRDVVVSGLKEQRSARRWKIFFRFTYVFMFFLFFLLFAGLLADGDNGEREALNEYTAVIDINGPIMVGMDANADSIISGLRSAFEDEKTKGVVVRINSPGGSPVQAGYVNDEIHRLRDIYPEKPLYAVITDLCASGGYYIAVAADKIYADKASMVGSIGVRMDNFGVSEAISRVGVERRLITAGDHKGMLDPFSPVNDFEVNHVQSMLNGIHEQFISVVKSGRGERLQDDPNIFSGLIWTGEQAQELGLVDGLGSTAWVAREVIGVEDLIDFTPEKDLFSRLSGGVSASISNVLFNVISKQSVQLNMNMLTLF